MCQQGHTALTSEFVGFNRFRVQGLLGWGVGFWGSPFEESRLEFFQVTFCAARYAVFAACVCALARGGAVLTHRLVLRPVVLKAGNRTVPSGLAASTKTQLVTGSGGLPTFRAYKNKVYVWLSYD